LAQPQAFELDFSHNTASSPFHSQLQSWKNRILLGRWLRLPEAAATEITIIGTNCEP
jgi:hypothetical protein